MALIILHALPALAKDGYGLSMTGTPKYTSASPHVDYANPNAPKGGTLKQAAIGSFDTLNPYTIKGKSPPGLDLVTDRLMARVWDEPFTMYPLIAEQAVVPADRSSVTFHLNPKARFHDGTPITTDDVLFSYETLKEFGRPNMRRVYKLARAQKINERTIRFQFGDGHDRETVMIFAMMPILSKAYWQGKTFDETTLKAPLGSGPYKIAQVDPGRQITYERVKDYWAQNLLPNVGHNNFDRIVYDFYRDDSVAFEAFKSGDLNFRREWDAGLWTSGYDFPAAQKNLVKKDALSHGRPDRVRGFIFNTRRDPFDDIRVRQALALAFDFEWVNKNLYHGLYRHIDSYFPNTELSAPPHKTQPQSRRSALKQADQLLKDAGWVIQNGKRVQAKTGQGFDFEIMLDDPGNEKIALAFVGNLKRLGITPRVRVLDTAAFRGRLNDYDFDMTLYFWMSTLSPGTEQYLYWGCEAATQPGRWNYAGICDPVIDDLSKSIAKATTRAELVKTVQTLDQKLMAGSYMIPLYYNPYDFVTYWPPVQRPEKTPLYGTVIETWWMDAPAP
ncbi:MAG: ABC transporter substrate-binding protein [Alphaproteobacteria bacterium]|nr:ABC transporter substrate-binding protein [Alphaproteobacteria bacterium]